MDRKVLAVVAAIVVVIGGGLVYSISGGSSDDSETSQTASTATADDSSSGGGTEPAADKPGNKATDDTQAAGAYVDYAPELIAETPGNKLLFFHAPWCSQCQALEADIEASDIPAGTTIFKVDYDTNQDLRQEYGVTIQTTMVKVDKDGNKVDELVAYDEPTFESVERALIQ
ncbi:MAG: thioredoxin family protein [Solirubrobacterales bacterium]